MAGIVYSDYYLPEEKISSREVVGLHLNDKERDNFCNFCKIDHVYIENKRDDFEIFIDLIDKFFKRSNIPKDDIDYIIHAYPPRLMKGNISVHYFLQKYFEMNKATVFAMSLACGTTLQAIQIADALIEAGRAKNVMILTIQIGFEFAERLRTTTIIGDGAGIMVIGKDNTEASIQDYISCSDGSHSFYEYNKIPLDFDHFKFINYGSELINETITKNNLTKDDIKLIIPQNINYHLYYNFYTKFIGISPEKLYLKNLPNGGHLADVDTVRNYTDVIREAALKKGDKFMIYGMGIEEMDITYNTILLQYNK